jgi:hypothetical protein
MAKKNGVSVNIEYSDLLGRVIRRDPWTQLGRSSWILLQEAIKAKDNETALDLAKYLLVEGKNLHDGYCDWIYGDLDYIAKTYGEEEIPKMLRHSYAVLTKSVYQYISGTTLEDIIRLSAEFNRSHRGGPGEVGNISIAEDEEKYIMTFDPCGSGGRMRRTGEIDGLPPRTDPPFNLGRTSKPYPWSWSKAGVPYYCAHCCVWNEQLTVESVGYPVRVTEYSDDPGKPCAFHYYKKPELIPEHYFTRIGKVKDPSKFKR